MSPLSGYQVISKIVPQVDTQNSNKEFNFTFGSSDLIGDTPVSGSSITFNGATDYKISLLSTSPTHGTKRGPRLPSFAEKKKKTENEKTISLCVYWFCYTPDNLIATMPEISRSCAP